MKRMASNALGTLAAMAMMLMCVVPNVNADPISVCTGVGCSTTNVTGTIVAGNGTVTISANNNLTNSVFPIGSRLAVSRYETRGLISHVT